MLYVNSVRLEKTGPGTLSSIFTPVYYSIPAQCLREGVNEILYRPEGSYGAAGIRKKISIVQGPRWEEKLTAGEVIYTQIPIVIMVFNLSLLVPLLIFYLLNRRMRMLGFSSLVLVMFILFTGLQFIPAWYTGIIVPRLHLALMPFFGYLMVKSVQTVNRVSLPLVNRIVFAASVLTSAVILFLSRRITEVAVPYILLGGLCITIIISLLVLAEIKASRRDIVNVVVAMMFILLTAGIILCEVAYYYFNGTTAFLSLVYSSPAFVLLYIFILARDYMRSMAGTGEVDRAVRDLESRKNWKPTITDLSEGKLEMIIDFIRKNYTRELSREGMACAFDMSTDYMSRLFKKYTGKKLNEYINLLRIREAKSRLRTRDVKIIDIALSVGFESLPTFNRVFKNITGLSPSRYRRMVQRPRTGAGQSAVTDDHRAGSPPSP